MSEGTEVSSKRNLLLPLLILVFVLALIVGGILLYRYQSGKATETNKASSEVKDLVEKIGKLMELPTGEEPTVATVSDKSKLSDQPFFAKSENGDKVLIYTNAKKAILFRPSTGKIIEVAPVNFDQSLSPSPSSQASSSPNASPASTPQANKTYKVIVYNGTNVSGLARRTATDLESKLENVEVTETHDAAKKDYTKTLVVDLTGSNSQMASTIAKALNGVVGPLPAGEDKPSGVDLIVIVGQ